MKNIAYRLIALALSSLLCLPSVAGNDGSSFDPSTPIGFGLLMKQVEKRRADILMVLSQEGADSPGDSYQIFKNALIDLSQTRKNATSFKQISDAWVPYFIFFSTYTYGAKPNALSSNQRAAAEYLLRWLLPELFMAKIPAVHAIELQAALTRLGYGAKEIPKILEYAMDHASIPTTFHDAYISLLSLQKSQSAEEPARNLLSYLARFGAEAMHGDRPLPVFINDIENRTGFTAHAIWTSFIDTFLIEGLKGKQLEAFLLCLPSPTAPAHQKRDGSDPNFPGPRELAIRFQAAVYAIVNHWPSGPRPVAFLSEPFIDLMQRSKTIEETDLRDAIAIATELASCGRKIARMMEQIPKFTWPLSFDPQS